MDRRGQSLPKHATVFINEAPRFDEDGNVFHASYGSGDAEFSVAFTPCTLQAGILAAEAALAKWRVKQMGVITPISRKKR